jgi:hypothetical protein
MMPSRETLLNNAVIDAPKLRRPGAGAESEDIKQSFIAGSSAGGWRYKLRAISGVRTYGALQISILRHTGLLSEDRIIINCLLWISIHRKLPGLGFSFRMRSGANRRIFFRW